MHKIRKIIIGCLVIGSVICGVQVLGSAAEDHEIKAKSLAAYAVGVMYDLHGQTNLAISQFKKASEHKDNYAIRLRLGADYARLGELSLAQYHLKKALEYDPQNVQARYLLALIYSTQKDYDLAAKEYESILTSFAQAEPENVEIYGYLAQLYYSQKQYDKAIQQFEVVLSLEPQNIDVMFLLGALYLETGDEEKAVAFFERTLKNDPAHDACLNSLAYIYADRGEKLSYAQELVERALEIDPDNGAYLDTLGWVYFKSGDTEKALEYLTKASEILDDPVIFEHLGDVYFEMQDFETARTFWNKSLEMLPQQKDIIKKVEQLAVSDEKNAPEE